MSIHEMQIEREQRKLLYLSSSSCFNVFLKLYLEVISLRVGSKLFHEEGKSINDIFCTNECVVLGTLSFLKVYLRTFAI